MSDSELPSNPPAPPPPPPPSNRPERAFKPLISTGSRYAEMEHHELIRMLDTVDDERARARFRESVYISLFVWIVVAWFLFYGPQMIFRQPRLVDPSVALRRQHDEEISQLNMQSALRHLAPQPKPASKPPTVDSKLLEKLRAAAPPPAPAPPPPPTPPTTQPTILPPVQPTPTPQPTRTPQPASIPDAPSVSRLNLNQPNPADVVRNAAPRGGFSGGGTTTGPGRPSSHPGMSAGPEIVSDTQGVDFNDYMRRLKQIIESHWYPLLPESVYPPISEHGITGIDFKILPNGDIGGVTVFSASGSRALDHAAFGSITSAGKLPPLPKEFHGPLLEIHCGYYVNEKTPD